MREHFAIDPLIGKRSQLLLATQLCRMVLKVNLAVSYLRSTPMLTLYQINNVIISGDDESEF